MSATNVTTSVGTGAHVDAVAMASAVRTGAHVDAVAMASAVHTGAHVDAVAMASAVRTGAHVDVSNAMTSVAGTGVPVGAASKLDVAIVRTQAKAALIGLGWKPAVAHAAVAEAATALGTEMALERLIFEALRRCPAPRA